MAAPMASADYHNHALSLQEDAVHAGTTYEITVMGPISQETITLYDRGPGASTSVEFNSVRVNGSIAQLNIR